jgi:2-methylcitrate dehydratase PrpD
MNARTPTSLPDDVTEQLAAQIVGSRYETLPANLIHEAKRALLNITGCALGGCRHPAFDTAVEALGPYAGRPTARVIGRPERFDPLFAALLNGISSHVHDYDDTTPANYIHNSSPVASALFAYASCVPVSGRELLHAFIVGFEVSSRIGNATYPAHYDAGWHSTGSIGVFGATAAIGLLEGLSARQMTHALGLAATQASGLREMFGSMAKSFHPGRAAQGGYTAVLLAQRGFTAGVHGLEGPRGFAPVTAAAAYDLARVTGGFGEVFELFGNTYKPFPCGIVTHPTIDACIQLHREHALEAEAIASVRLTVAPLVKDLCNKQRIESGLEGKFSIYHGAAIGLARGRAGLAEFTDEAVRDPQLARLRSVTEAVGDPRISEDAVEVEVRLNDGRVLRKLLEQSIGNLARPMSDADLEAKLYDQTQVLTRERAQRVVELCWSVDQLADARDLIEAAVPPH